MCQSYDPSSPFCKQTMSEFIWKRQELQNTHISQPEKKRHVLVLYTGGTIGSKWTEKGTKCKSFSFTSQKGM